MKTLAALVLVPFSAYTGFVLVQDGFIGFFELVFAHHASTQLWIDLGIALGFVVAGMWVDHKRVGARFWPFALVTLVFGAIGPLLYVLFRPTDPAEEDAG